PLRLGRDRPGPGRRGARTEAAAVYLDFLQDCRGQTLAVPCSMRPAPDATVSTPRWREVKRGLDPAPFTIKSVPERVEKPGDHWEPILGPDIDLADCPERPARAAGKVRRRSRRRPFREPIGMPFSC